MRKVANGHNTHLHRPDKTAQKKLNTERTRLNQMEASLPELLYPPGCKAFQGPEGFPEMDSPFESTKENDGVCTVTLPKGCTRKEAMAHIHHRTTMPLKSVTIQGLE